MKLSRRILVTALAGVTALSLCVDAPADRDGAKISHEVKKRASAYFSKGEMLFEQEEYAKAAEAFQLAYDTLPHPATLVNLGRCYEKAGRIGDAVETYRRFLLETSDFEGIAVRGVKERLLELEPKVGELAISCDLRDCQIRVDGIPRGAAPVQLLLENGVHKVEGLSLGRVAVVRECRVISNRVTAIELRVSQGDQTTPQNDWGVAADGEMVGQDPLGAEVSLSTEDDGPPLGIPFWIAAGATVAVGAATAAVGIRLVGVKSDFDEARGASSDESTLDDLSQKGRRLQIATNVLFGLTGALALTSATFAIVDLVGGSKDEDEKIGLCPGPGIGIGAYGRF